MKNKKQKTIAVLEQFIDTNNPKRFTYAYAFWGKSYGNILPHAIAVFRVYRKYKRPWYAILFPFIEKRWWAKRLIESQINEAE